MNTENQVYRELQRYLDRMMRKGLILTVEEGYDEAHYCNAEFAMEACLMQAPIMPGGTSIWVSGAISPSKKPLNPG